MYVNCRVKSHCVNLRKKVYILVTKKYSDHGVQNTDNRGYSKIYLA